MDAAFDVKAFFAQRDDLRRQFLSQYLSQSFDIIPIGEDWASRHYFRVTLADGSTRILLESVPDHMPTATLGHKLADFIRIATMLQERGIHAPRIDAADEGEGFVLLEDFGSISVYSAIQAGGDQKELYKAAADVLIKMRDTVSLDDLCGFPKYKDSYIRKGMQRIVDWYIPATRREKNDDDLLSSYLAAWDEVSANLPPPPIGFVHGDFHTQNLMLLQDGSCGVLDFQDAMAGPLPYDLANLLENIRTDVPPDIYQATMNYYGADETFKAWFRVVATQFHCRIIGQVIRLSVLSGKHDLLRFMPRIQNYLKEGLKDPVLKPLADWFKDQKVDLSAEGIFNPDAIRPFIRDDAF